MNVLISPRKHMLWVLIRNTSSRHFNEYPQHIFSWRNKKKCLSENPLFKGYDYCIMHLNGNWAKLAILQNLITSDKMFFVFFLFLQPKIMDIFLISTQKTYGYSLNHVKVSKTRLPWPFSKKKKKKKKKHTQKKKSKNICYFFWKKLYLLYSHYEWVPLREVSDPVF